MQSPILTMKTGKNRKKRAAPRSVFDKACEKIGEHIFNSFVKRAEWDVSCSTFGFLHSILDLIVTDGFYRVRRFIAVYPMNPGHKRVDAVYGDESPDGINAVPTRY